MSEPAYDIIIRADIHHLAWHVLSDQTEHGTTDTYLWREVPAAAVERLERYEDAAETLIRRAFPESEVDIRAGDLETEIEIEYLDQEEWQALGDDEMHDAMQQMEAARRRIEELLEEALRVPLGLRQMEGEEAARA